MVVIDAADKRTYANRQDGRKQYKVAVGHRERSRSWKLEAGESVSLPSRPRSRGANVTTDARNWRTYAVTGEGLEHTQGPKIPQSTSSRTDRLPQAQGQRQPLTVVKVTGIT